jgi:methanogenic corrinoid protein MtbC1
LTDALENIAIAISTLDSSDHAKAVVTDALSQGFSPTEIAEKGIRRGLQIVGEKYEASEYFLSELLYAGSLVSDLFELLKPSMKNNQLERKGVIVLGTVRGDIHDLGKNIFKMLADSSGFEVHDLGVDVEPTAFVDQVKESRPQVLGLSALLTTALMEMKSTLDALRAAGVKGNLKVLLGGNAVKKEFGVEIGADATALDAVEGLEICRGWTKK